MLGADVMDIFPIKKMDDLLIFMSNIDGDFKRRKIAFEHMLYQLATKNADQSNFGTILMHALFERKFLIGLKWPSAK